MWLAFDVSEWESLEAIFFSYKKWLEWCFTWNVAILRLIFFYNHDCGLVNQWGVNLQWACLSVCGRVNL